MIDTPEIKSTQFYQIIVKVHHPKQGVHHSTILTAQGPLISARFKSRLLNKCLFLCYFFQIKTTILLFFALILVVCQLSYAQKCEEEDPLDCLRKNIPGEPGK